MRLLDKLRGKPAPAAPRPHMTPGTRVYAVGDIHGRCDLLDELQTMILQDARDYEGRKILIFLGDFIDRGTESQAVIDRMIDAPPPGFESIYLRGNHEQALLQALEQSPASGHDDLLTIDTYRQLGDGLARQWLQRLRQLPEVFQGDGWVATHAGFDVSGRPDLHIREPFWDHYDGRYGRVVVGHTPRPAVECQDNIVMIDTGAVYGGLLSAFCPETDAVVQVQGPRASSTTLAHPQELATGLPC